ncbi:hypothetical protein SmJEL517_g01352 [Synchytrium microbalum]|uniref:Uncharacterized protein n=1 Tax=Synchytrium microbalum TaxID=1806994 RepID=A0A507CAY6_9FUNG|nr:uncharacterized protein SmJEL517_g01352 [Synchytrium microbalum]TPX36508.1 hypothetical protein SmJEL517_g01352 [Synchytrium microbalum]
MDVPASQKPPRPNLQQPPRPSLEGNTRSNVTFKVPRFQTEKVPLQHGQVIEHLQENQRGSALFGKPRFSSKSLLPSDFPAWSDTRGTFRTEKEHQNPPPGWAWVQPSWVLDLHGDVDAEGWCYGFSFNAKHWQGISLSYDFELLSFFVFVHRYDPSPIITTIIGNAAPTVYVRKRSWSRTRKPVDPKSIPASSTALNFPVGSKFQHNAHESMYTDRSSTSASTVTTDTVPNLTAGDVYTRMAHARCDRERLLVVAEIAGTEEVSVLPMQKLIGDFNHDYCKLAAMKLLLANEPSEKLAASLNQMVDLLPFYGDKMELVSHFKGHL